MLLLAASAVGLRMNIVVGRQRLAHRRLGRSAMILVRELSLNLGVALRMLNLRVHARRSGFAPGCPV